MENIKLWENIIKGWILSLVGLSIVLADLGDFFGMWVLPYYTGTVFGLEVNKPVQIFLSLAVGIVLFFAPATFEGIIEDKIKSFGKK
jgi:hypothetical protein